MSNEIKVNEDIKIVIDGEIVGKLTSFNPSNREITEVYQLSNKHEDIYFPGEVTYTGTITPRSELTIIQSEIEPVAISWTCSETIGIGIVNARSVSSMFIKPSWQQNMRKIIDNTTEI